MAAPRYTPIEGVGATYTDEQGNSYQFNGRTWEQISTGASSTVSSYSSPPATTSRSSGSGGGQYSLKEYFGGKDTDAYRRYKEGQKAGKWADLPDFIDKGGDQSGEINKPTSMGDIVNEIMESQQEIIEQETNWLDEYTEDNPFIFDEELARESATAEYEPYYSELLEDYLQDVDVKRETIQDEEQLAQDLFRSESGTLNRQYQQAVSEAQQGFAGSGLFYSGIKQRSLGRGEVEKGATDERRQAKRAYGERQTGRELSSLETAAQRRERDLQREQETAIESGILQRESEAEKQYYGGLTSAYHRRFPSSSGSSLQGYLVPEFARF